MGNIRWLAAALLVALGCQSRTEVVVGVATDLKARGQLDLVKFTATRNAVPLVAHEWSLADVPAGQYELPGSFGLYSPDGNEPRVELEVTGYQGTQLLVRRTSILSLVANQTLFLRLGLVGDCSLLDGPSCSGDESCVEGVCRPKAIDSLRLPQFRNDLVTRVSCQGGTQFVVSSTGQPMAQSGPGCTANQYCQEGTCYGLLKNEDGGLQQGLWTDETTPTTNVLTDVTPTTADGSEAIAVGEHGTILHLGAGGSWASETDPTTDALLGVWAAPSGDVIAVGGGGTILRRRGGVWAAEAGPPVSRLEAVWGAGDSDVWAVGRDGTAGVVLHFDGATWQVDARASAPGPLRAVWGGGGEVWAVGGPTVLHFDGAGWAPLATDAGADLYGVGGVAGGPVYVVGRRGLVARVDGGAFAAEAAPTSVDLFAVAGVTADDVRVVGDYGFVMRGPVWTAEVAHTHQPINGVCVAGGKLLAVARDGVVLRAPREGGVPDGGIPDLAMACTAAGCACAHDADCDATLFCGAGGTCQAQKSQGTACNTDAAGNCQEAGCRECGALFCTDHVCCDKSPQQCGGCAQCVSPTGTCENVPSGQDPKASCSGMTAECTQTACNGKGSCANTGNSCGTDACSAAALTTHSCVDGTCTANVPAAPCPGGSGCNPAGDACLAKCTADTDCLDPFFCNKSGSCQPRKAAGATGTCKPASDCINAGNCRECNAGLSCLDGYCCAGPCTGTCQACDVTGAEGSCAPVTSGGPHGGRVCGGGTDAMCAPFCSNRSTANCTFPTRACGNDSCSSNELATNSCAAGTCAANALQACATGYICPASGTACNTTCATDADCDTAALYYCAKNPGNPTGPGQCTLQKDPGTLCNRSNECKDLASCHLCKGSDTCIDGRCCAGPCNAACKACDATGTCSRIGTAVAHAQPASGHGTCPGGGAGTCGQYCDGSSDSCISTNGINCGNAPSCSAANNYTILGQATCSAGTCGTQPTTPCYPYGCLAGPACAAGCSTGNQSVNCATNAPDPLDAANPVTYQCSPAVAAAGYCGKPSGRLCKNAGDCASGFCVGGTCCGSACTPTSKCGSDATGPYQNAIDANSCSTGTCTPVKTYCTATNYCDPTTQLCAAPCFCQCQSAAGALMGSCDPAPTCPRGWTCQGRCTGVCGGNLICSQFGNSTTYVCHP